MDSLLKLLEPARPIIDHVVDDQGQTLQAIQYHIWNDRFLIRYQFYLTTNLRSQNRAKTERHLANGKLFLLLKAFDGKFRNCKALSWKTKLGFAEPSRALNPR